MKSNKIAILSVMFCFFAMGFVDLVGIASNYVKEDLGLSDSLAGFLPGMVFFWFLIFSIPTSVLMNKIGRKKTVLLSLVVTLVSLLLPLFGETFATMIIAFSLLGIGNAIMQTSLNPLVTCVVPAANKKGGHDSGLASTLTFGQFIKAIASFSAPYFAMWGATQLIPEFGYSWRILFAIFLVIGILATAVLASIDIHEPVNVSANVSVGKQFAGAFALLGKPIILLSFLGIVCHVGCDVGTNTYAPKILMERLGLTLNDAAFATSLYFIFRTIGCFTGSFFLRIMKTRYFFIISVICMALSMICMSFAGGSGEQAQNIGQEAWMLYAGIALVGYGNSNIFSMCFANAMEALPEKQNEISGLMIMGLIGGTILPIAMGFASDAMGVGGAVLCMSVCVLYLFTYIPRIKN